jgi:hypothetical protein
MAFSCVMMARAFLFVAAVIFSIVSAAAQSSATTPTCSEVLAKTPKGKQPLHDTLHEAAWDNDAESLCLLLEQPDAHVNLKSDK